MITPRETFCQQHGKTWTDVVDSSVFQSAVQTALVEMCREQRTATDAQIAAANAWRLEGAKQFLGILMHLADPLPERKAPTEPKLNYRL